MRAGKRAMRMKDDGLVDSVAFAHRAKDMEAWDMEAWLARKAPRARKSPAEMIRPGYIARTFVVAAIRDDVSGYLFP